MAKAIEKKDDAASVAAEAVEVTVTWNGGSRVYSKEVHGEGFQDLAQQFATKFNGTIA